MKYVVQVVENLTRCVIVEAENRTQAENKARQAYSDGQIVLDYDDFDGCFIRCKGRATENDILNCDILEVEE